MCGIITSKKFCLNGQPNGFLANHAQGFKCQKTELHFHLLLMSTTF